MSAPTADPTQATVTAALLRLQAARGWLSPAALRELAVDLGEPLSRLEEVVSFFPHFRRSPPPAVELSVCHDLTCHHRGADPFLGRLGEAFAGDNRITVKPVSCLGRCDRAVAACISRHHGGDEIHDALYLNRTADELVAIAQAAVEGKPLPSPDTDADLLPTRPVWKLDATADLPPYTVSLDQWAKVRRAEATGDDRSTVAADILARVDQSGLRGMGGAGEPAGRKWKDVAGARGDEKYIVVNGDESEPGTFKDREILLRYPHLVVEGVILAGLACGASRGYLFIRHEYPEQAAAVREAITAAERAGACGPFFPITVFVSPGGYICGEQSALIEAMEGRRAQPRNRPPTLATNGLFDRPTLLSNVETFAWVPGIVRHGGDWYRGLSSAGTGGRLFSLSGDVVRPGVYERPIGSTLRELIEAAGGVVGGENNLLAVATSGPSGGFVPRLVSSGGARQTATLFDLLDAPLDIDAFRKLGLALGAGLAVYAYGSDLTAAAINATAFFRNESCGKCVPCRVGCQKLLDIGRSLVGRAVPTDEQVVVKQVVADLDRALAQTSICGLGPSASKPLLSLLQYFPLTGR